MFAAYLHFAEEFPWFFTSAVFLFGAIMGSFLNVCIYRLPAGQSVVKPRSHCGCGQLIAWYDNIPILSWLILRGRARCCGRPFSIRYPLIELTTAILFLECWTHLPPAKALCGMVFISLLTVATFVDLDHYIIPDACSVWGACTGLALSVLIPSLHHQSSGVYLISSMRSGLTGIEGMLIGSSLLLWVAFVAEAILKKEAMGMGDIKLLGAIGAFCGWQGAIFSIFGGALLGTLWSLIAMAVRHLIGPEKAAGIEPTKEISTEESLDAQSPTDALLNPSMGTLVPFGPMLAAAAVVYFLWLQPPVDRYFENLKVLFTG